MGACLGLGRRPQLVCSDLPRAHDPLSEKEQQMAKKTYIGALQFETKDGKKKDKSTLGPLHAMRTIAKKLWLTPEQQQCVAIIGEVCDPRSLDADEICNVLALTKSRQERAALLFAAIDRDGNETLDASELALAVMALTPGMTKKKSARVAKELLSTVDTDGNGTVDLDEFQAGLDFIEARLKLVEMVKAIPTLRTEIAIRDPQSEEGKSESGVLGMTLSVDLRVDGPVMRVDSVAPGGPAAAVGLQKGACIAAVGHPPKRVGDLARWHTRTIPKIPGAPQDSRSVMLNMDVELDDDSTARIADAFRAAVIAVAEEPRRELPGGLRTGEGYVVVMGDSGVTDGGQRRIAQAYVECDRKKDRLGHDAAAQRVQKEQDRVERERKAAEEAQKEKERKAAEEKMAIRKAKRAAARGQARGSAHP